jgi:hypothetical protein
LKITKTSETELRYRDLHCSRFQLRRRKSRSSSISPAHCVHSFRNASFQCGRRDVLNDPTYSSSFFSTNSFHSFSLDLLYTAGSPQTFDNQQSLTEITFWEYRSTPAIRAFIRKASAVFLSGLTDHLCEKTMDGALLETTMDRAGGPGRQALLRLVAVAICPDCCTAIENQKSDETRSWSENRETFFLQDS